MKDLRLSIVFIHLDEKNKQYKYTYQYVHLHYIFLFCVNIPLRIKFFRLPLFYNILDVECLNSQPVFQLLSVKLKCTT